MSQFGPIQVIPPGLLSFFQLKSLGQNPDTIDSNLSPSLELRDWYMQARNVDWLNQVGAGSAPTRTLGDGVTQFRAFSPNDIQVPSNEIWWIENFTVVAQLPNATDTAQFSCGYVRPIVGNQSPYVTGPVVGPMTGVAGKNRVLMAGSGGYWVPGGSSLGMVVMINETAGTILYAGYLRYVAIPV